MLGKTKSCISGHRKSAEPELLRLRAISPPPGNFTAGVGRQYIGEIGKTDNPIVVVTTHLYDGKKSLPLDIELYQPRPKREIDYFITNVDSVIPMNHELSKLNI